MKTLTKAIVLGLITLSFSWTALAGTPEKLDEFVAKTEQECGTYTKEDWSKSRSDYRALVEEYRNDKTQFTQEEKEKVIHAMGRYNALLIKNGIIKSSTSIQEFGAMLPDFIKGLSEGLEANSDEIHQSLKSLVDTSKVKGAIKSLGEALEKIFNPEDKD